MNAASNPRVNLRSENKKRLCSVVAHVWMFHTESHRDGHTLVKHRRWLKGTFCVSYRCTSTSIFTLKIGNYLKHIWEIWHVNRKICVLQCGDTQCQDVIPSVWPRAIFVSVKMGLVPQIQSCMPTWNSTGHTLVNGGKTQERGMKTWKEPENERTGGQVSHQGLSVRRSQMVRQ